MQTIITPERLGVFGFSWQEKLAANIGYPVTFLNASNYGAIVNSMNRRLAFYNGQGIKDKSKLVSLIAADTQQSPEKVSAFIDQMALKKKTGEIVLAKPEGKPAMPLGINLKPIMVLIGLGLAAYILAQIKPFLPKARAA